MVRRQVALAIAFAVALLASAGARAQDQHFRTDSCTRPYSQSGMDSWDPSDLALQRQIASTCGNVAATARGIEAARARFYAGRANARLPDQNDEAIRQLEIAVNVGKDFESQFRPELRAARLELAQAYRVKGRLEPARQILADPSLSPGDPAVAYQRAMLTLAELHSAGEDAAFAALKETFDQDDAQLRGRPTDIVRLSPLEIQRGRSWLYWLGMSLGEQILRAPSRDADQRRSDALRAIDYFRPVTDTVSVACPDPQPLACGAISSTEQIGDIGFPNPPTSDQTLDAFFQLGIAHLKAAGLQDAAGLSAFSDARSISQAGRLDCFTTELTPDAASHFQNARNAFEVVTRRSSAVTDTVRDAHWGLGCTILANLSNIRRPDERQRQLAQAIDEFQQAPSRALTLLTLARAQMLQGQADAANASYRRALALSGDNGQCRAGGESNSRNRAELPSRIYLEMARTRFFDGGTAPLMSSPEIYDRTIGTVTNARPATLRAAEAELHCAIVLDNDNVEARLTLGAIYLRLGSDPGEDSNIDPVPFPKASQALSYFETQRAGAAEGRAEGLYLLSHRLTLIQQDRLADGGGYGANGNAAVSFAAQAYNSEQRPQFRRQACLAQTLFGQTATEGYCQAAPGNGYAESLLYEGMYWLRRGQRESEGRMSSWSRSIQAFNRGIAEASDGDVADSVHPTLPENISLKDLLQYGQRYVLRCTRLDYGDRETASGEVKAFFKLSGMPDPCGGAPR